MGGCTPSARRTLLLVLTSAAANTVSVTKQIWSDSAQSAIAAAKPDWAAADRGCVATIASATPPYLSYDGRDTTKPKLCRVDHGGEVDAEKTTILAMVDSPQYLEQRGNWEAFLNKASYCRRTRRKFYIWIGVPPPSILNARVDAPWARCRDKARGNANTLNGVKNLAFLALFDDPSIDKVLYIDADAWFSSSDIEPESYFALTDSDLLGNQNRVGGPKIPMNGGLVFARRSEFTQQFFALWWRGRCGAHDQLPLWATLFAAWSAATDGAYRFDDEHFKKYSHAHAEAVSLLQRDAMYIRQKAGMKGPYDGGNFSATGLLYDVPLALPHVLLLPSAPVGSLPAVRSDPVRSRPTFVCHTRIEKDEQGQCVGADVCAAGRCDPFLSLTKSSLAVGRFVLLGFFVALNAAVLSRRPALRRRLAERVLALFSGGR